MANPDPTPNKADPIPLQTIRLIKKLLKQRDHEGNPIPKAVIARRAGVSRAQVYMIAVGRLHAGTDATIDSLGLFRPTVQATCRICGNTTYLLTRSVLCPTCELLELAKAGVITITVQQEVSENDSYRNQA